MEGLTRTRPALTAALTALVLPLGPRVLADAPAREYQRVHPAASLVGQLAPSREPGVRPAPAWGVRPVDGPVVRAFAPPAQEYGAGHRGVDLSAAPGEEVRAALAGTVAFAGQVAGGSWVTVNHGGGLRTTYGILARLRVGTGEPVTAGAVLGVLADGADHLDWGALRDDAYVDPLTLIGTRHAHLVDPERLQARLAAARTAPAAAGVPAGLRWPVAGRVTSGFGLRTHPVTGVRQLHAGVDVAAPSGTPVVAAAAGTVTFAGERGGYGLLVVVDHGGGLETRYAHASAVEVRAGQQVEPGQLVARVGATGTATGPHLHVEVRLGGVPRDPLGVLPTGP